MEKIVDKIKICIQCGTCSSSCPLNFAMDIPMRKLIGLIKAGYIKDVLKSKTFWLCLSCYFCKIRCPKNIDLPEVMYNLHEICLKENILPENEITLQIYKAFMKVVNNFGRNFEPLMLFFSLYKFPKKLLKFLPLGIFFLKAKRIHLFPYKIKNSDSLKNLLKEADLIEI
jgi:heterodisulfide reductase subunit C